MKKYRNEWKFVCSDFDVNLLYDRFSSILNKDKNASSNGSYYIHSLYFDDIKNRCAKENESGIEKRYKWRIRYYNNDINTLHLERKEKYLGRCHKDSCKITIEEFYNLFRGNVLGLWDSNRKVLRDFAIDIMAKGFRPKLIVSYERIAFVDKFLNIRITIDKNINISKDYDKFLDNNFFRFPLQEKNYQVLEVKFDDLLPGYIRSIISTYNFKQTSFSKYFLGFKLMEGFVK